MLLGILGGLLGVVGVVFLFTRYLLLAAPSLVLEGHGVFASLRRAGQLSRGQFWRLFGIYLLANLTTSFVAQVIAIPFSIVGVALLFVLPEGWALAGMLLASNTATVLTGALVGPFNCGGAGPAVLRPAVPQGGAGTSSCSTSRSHAGGPR